MSSSPGLARTLARRATLPTSLLCLFGVEASAQEQRDDASLIDRVVVTASGFEQKIAGGEKLRCRHADPPVAAFGV